MIISKNMETFSAEAVSSDTHLKDLYRLYDTTELHIQSLKSLGVEATSWSHVVVSTPRLTPTGNETHCEQKSIL